LEQGDGVLEEAIAVENARQREMDALVEREPGTFREDSPPRSERYQYDGGAPVVVGVAGVSWAPDVVLARMPQRGFSAADRGSGRR
jgi:hypothetical protein